MLMLTGIWAQMCPTLTRGLAQQAQMRVIVALIAELHIWTVIWLLLCMHLWVGMRMRREQRMRVDFQACSGAETSVCCGEADAQM